jgi:hypothetical protein
MEFILNILSQQVDGILLCPANNHTKSVDMIRQSNTPFCVVDRQIPGSGELINEEGLYEALVSKTIAGAASDVFSSEPPQPGEKLLTLDNFLLTAHIGALTDEAGERMVMVSTNNLLESLS